VPSEGSEDIVGEQKLEHLRRQVNIFQKMYEV
jgi:hypothetical protein